MRAYMRAQVQSTACIDERGRSIRSGSTARQVEDMYRILALANYEDRFVIPTTHREYAENAFDLRNSCGFSFGDGCSGGAAEGGLFGTPPHRHGVKAKAEA